MLEGYQSKPWHICVFRQLATFIQYTSNNAGPEANDTSCAIKDWSRIFAAYGR